VSTTTKLVQAWISRDSQENINYTERLSYSARYLGHRAVGVLSHAAYFTCHYQGVSHAEWPKNNDEYAPPQLGEAIR
jgi:hypothetical protein